MRKTIILLSAKRCGSTAVLNVFRKHPKVNISSDKKNRPNLEINFWNNAYDELYNRPNSLRKNLKKYMPSVFKNKKIKISKIEDIFNLWNLILKKKGPIIFDKSPKYLENYKYLNLILKYKKKYNLTLIGLIRNPLDAITSQHELWHQYTKEKNLKNREAQWLKYYLNLEKLKKKDFKLIKYENLVRNKKKNFKLLFNYAKLEFKNEYISDFDNILKPRYQISMFKNIKNWKWNKKFEKHLIKYKYFNIINKKKSYSYIHNLKFDNLKRYIPLGLKNFLRAYIKI